MSEQGNSFNVMMNYFRILAESTECNLTRQLKLKYFSLSKTSWSSYIYKKYDPTLKSLSSNMNCISKSIILEAYESLNIGGHLLL